MRYWMRPGHSEVAVFGARAVPTLLAGIFHGPWYILQDGIEFEPICRLSGKPRLAWTT
jgi:hypothetical protein